MTASPSTSLLPDGETPNRMTASPSVRPPGSIA